jgi:hypothetical protein
MKILFWNIGKDLTYKKQDLIFQVITEQAPDIFCVAEGSTSILNCQIIIDLFETSGYTCYYSPLFYNYSRLKLNYKFKKNGLKIFIKDKSILKENFSFANQRQDGRIVVLKATINLKLTTIVFLHNFAKSGNREVTDDQRKFISSLTDMIEIGRVSKDTERLIVIGDFNLEPWDNILRHKSYLKTSFIHKHNSINLRKTNNNNYYFNPIAEMIFHSKIENLGGTYYSDSNGWALFDYCLYDTKNMIVTYDVITEINEENILLNYDMSIHGNFLYEELDHLPILTEIID